MLDELANGSPPTASMFGVTFALASRRFAGHEVLDARRALLVAACERWAGEAPDRVRALFRQGSVDEQRAIVQSLAALPQPERFEPLAAEACRANALAVFEALALDNPYPAQHLSEGAFNQLVLKAIFVGVDARQIDGLASRVNPDLQRMVNDYVQERRAAARPIPDAALAIIAMNAQDAT